LQFIKATQFASANVSSNRHLFSSTSSGAGSSGSGNNGQTANPGSNNQKKKEADVKRKAIAKKVRGQAREQVPGLRNPRKGRSKHRMRVSDGADRYLRDASSPFVENGRNGAT
jgi:hypothetical protein